MPGQANDVLKALARWEAAHRRADVPLIARPCDKPYVACINPECAGTHEHCAWPDCGRRKEEHQR